MLRSIFIILLGLWALAPLHSQVGDGLIDPINYLRLERSAELFASPVAQTAAQSLLDHGPVTLDMRWSKDSTFVWTTFKPAVPVDSAAPSRSIYGRFANAPELLSQSEFYKDAPFATITVFDGASYAFLLHYLKAPPQSTINHFKSDYAIEKLIVYRSGPETFRALTFWVPLNFSLASPRLDLVECRMEEGQFLEYRAR